ncbi:MAG TPA: hypothetical protein VFD90_00095 [Gaiellales bacterium]|nr:hypothetical protein [Gaiellales bacterium]
MIRLTATGALDPAFGSRGRVALGHGGAVAIELRRPGAIVALGSWSHSAAVTADLPVMAAQLLPGGRLDTTFGKGGELLATTRLPSSGSALDCQGDLLVANSEGVKRFGPDGRLDPTFRTTSIPPVAVGAVTVPATLGEFAFSPSGTIVMGGFAGAFRIPALGSGRSIVRAVAIDRAGNRSRVVVRQVGAARSS